MVGQQEIRRVGALGSRVGRKPNLVVLVTALIVSSIVHGASVQVQDDAGRIISLQRPAQRIISLAPHITENIFAAGAGERLVGVSAYSNFPPQAQTLPQVSSFNAINVEAVLAQRPDLVIAWVTGNPREAVARLERLGLTVFRSEPRQLPDIANNIEAIGTLAGTEAQATVVAQALRQHLRDITERYANVTRFRVFYQVWDTPLMTVNGGHIISDALQRCGASNVFERLPLAAPTVSLEAVIAKNPDVIVLSSETGREEAWASAWQRFDGLAAVARKRFVLASAQAMGRHTPRLLVEVEKLCAALDRFR